jgi:membrane protease YdiL (CAAX protease family)
MPFANLTTLFFVLVMVLLWADRGPRERIILFLTERQWRLWLVPGLLWLAFAVCGLFSGEFVIGEFLKLIPYLALPTLCILGARKNPKHSFAYIIAGIALLRLPLDFHLIGIPAFDSHVRFTLAPYAMYLIFGLLAFQTERKIGAPISWKLTGRDLAYAFGVFAVMFFPLLGLGLHIGFLTWQPSPYLFDQQYMILFFIPRVLFPTALPEELLFRGLLQNTLAERFSKTFRSERLRFWAPIVLASLFFGLSHFEDGQEFVSLTSSIMHPNYGFMLLSFLAGGAFGYVYKKTGSLLAATFLHTLVDMVFWLCFLKGA